MFRRFAAIDVGKAGASARKYVINTVDVQGFIGNSGAVSSRTRMARITAETVIGSGCWLSVTHSHRREDCRGRRHTLMCCPMFGVGVAVAADIGAGPFEYVQIDLLPLADLLEHRAHH